MVRLVVSAFPKHTAIRKALGRLDSPGLCLGFELFFDFGTLDRLRVNVFSFSGSRGPFGRPFGYKFNVIEFSSIYIYIYYNR